jgi:outer membrane protein TolC
VWAAALLSLVSVGAAQTSAPRLAATPEQAAAELGYDLTKPLTLDQCLDLALRVHPDMRTAIANLHGALASLNQTRAAWWPSLTGSVQYNATRTPQRTIQVGGVPFPVGGGEATTRNMAVSGVYNLYQTGRDTAVSQAKHLARAAEAGVEDARRELAFLVSQAYFDILAADRLVAAEQAAVAAAQAHVDSVQAQIDAENAAPSQIHTVRAQLHQAQLDLVAAKNQAALARANLRSALGGPRTEVRIADAWQEPTSLPMLDECLARARAQRPDLAQAQATLQGAGMGLRLARQQQLPQLSLGASADYGRYNSDAGAGWSVFGSVGQTIFDGGALRAGVDTAKAQVETAEAQVARVELNLWLEVETAWLNLRESAERIAAAQALLTEARAALDAAERRYQADVGILLEVTDAQSRMTRAEVDLISAVYGYNTALADLKRAMGEGGDRGQGTRDRNGK